MAEMDEEWWSRNRVAFCQALREVFTIAVITLTPVWGGVVLSLLLQELPSFNAALHANADRGDLFLLSTATIAPLALYISVRPDSLPKPFSIHFPGGWFFILLLIVIFMISAILFSVKRMADVPSSTLRIDPDLFFTISFYVYGLSLALSLIVTSIKYSIDALPFEESFRQDTDRLAKAWHGRQRS